MKRRRMTIKDISLRQRISIVCRNNEYPLGLAYFQALVNMSNSVPNFKEEINVA